MTEVGVVKSISRGAEKGHPTKVLLKARVAWEGMSWSWWKKLKKLLGEDDIRSATFTSEYCFTGHRSPESSN